MSEEPVRVDTGGGGIATVTIDRPERLNALSMPTITALKDAFAALEAERIGLVHRIVPDEQTVDTALEIATSLAMHDRERLVLAKQIMWTNLTASSLESAFAVEARMWAHTGGA
jgi:enoyl-CoA hydratase